MNPATIQFAMLIGQLVLNDFVPMARQLVQLVHKPDPTLDDWNALIDSAEVEAKAALTRLASEGVKPTI